MEADLDRVLGDERLTLLGLFAETWASLTARANAHLAGFGLSGAEFEVCLRLARSPEGLLRMIGPGRPDDPDLQRHHPRGRPAGRARAGHPAQPARPTGGRPTP